METERRSNPGWPVRFGETRCWRIARPRLGLRRDPRHNKEAGPMVTIGPACFRRTNVKPWVLVSRVPRERRISFRQFPFQPALLFSLWEPRLVKPMNPATRKKLPGASHSSSDVNAPSTEVAMLIQAPLR